MRNSISKNITITAENLSKIFLVNGKHTAAFQDLNFCVNPGEFFCLIGPSGCGKSSILNTISGLEKPSAGKLIITDPQSNQKPKISMVFQEHGLFPWMTLKANIAFPLQNDPTIKKNEVDSICRHFLQKTSLLKFADYYPHQVSGGMKQRISIARSFAVDPDILLMDEPFVFLDYQNRLLLQELLLSLWQNSDKTIIFVTHDMNEAVLLSDRVMIMTAHPGCIKENISIDLPRPRNLFEIRKSPEFIEYVNRITDLLKDEMLVTQEQSYAQTSHEP